jgi:serine/threonine-protein kinase
MIAAAAPRRMGRYALYGPIAKGGMATVHFGRLEGEGGFSRIVAIKCLRSDLAENAEFRAMFLDEARLASRVRHPNVIPTLDVGSSPEGTFLVMEYVAGESVAGLAHELGQRGERFPLDIAIRVVIDALYGLHAAHTAVGEGRQPLGMVHRDVSPQNILVATDGLARVLDFGIAKAAGRITTTREGQLKGKFRYMAPEQFADTPITARTDVYSTSVVLWEVLTGQALFRAESDAAIFARVLEGVVPPPSSLVPELPKALDDVVMRGIGKDPARRFASAMDMAVALEAFGPLATPRRVGLWVEEVAGNVLKQRAQQIAAIEDTGSGAVVRVPPIPVDMSSTTTGTLEPSLNEGTVPNAAAKPVKSALRVAVPLAAALIGGVGLAAVAATKLHARQAASAPTPLSTAPSAVPAQPAAPAEGRLESGRKPEVDRVAAADTPVPSSSTAPASPPSARRGGAHPAASRSAGKPGCSPPWSVDATGIRRVKPDCL